MNFESARLLFLEEFFKGRRKNEKYEYEIFPYSRVLYLDEIFVKQKVLLNEIYTYDTEQWLVDKYVRRFENEESPPIWLSYGKKLKDGTVIKKWHQNFETLDGNHRIKATRTLGFSNINAILPESHYKLYLRNKD